MNKRQLAFVIFVLAMARLTDSFSLFSEIQQSIFPVHQAVHRRQVDEDLFMESWEPPVCVDAMEACMAAPNIFINDWTRAYQNQEPFRTDAARVIVFCRNVAAARLCVHNVGACEDSYIPEFLETLPVCSGPARAALVAMHGSVCRGMVEEDPLKDQCDMAVRTNRATVPTVVESVSNPDDFVNETVSESSYSSEESWTCRDRHAHLDCVVESYSRQCDNRVAHFIEIVSRPIAQRACADNSHS